MTCSAVLFDLDGTLADTYDLILASQIYATKTVLGVDIPPQRLMATMGIPLADQMADYTDDLAVVKELCEVYREHNDRVHDELIKGFAGVTEALQSLQDAGIPMGIVTSKRRDAAQKALDSLNIARFMSCLVGGTDTERHKPNPDPVLRGCEFLGVDPQRCVYVGDSPFDMHAGNAAGCKTIGVTWGPFSKEQLQGENPTRFAAAPQELSDLVLSL